MSAVSEARKQTSEVGDHRFEQIENRESRIGDQRPVAGPSTLNSQLSTVLRVSLLTGGDDKPYVIGCVSALTSIGINIDLIGSDDLMVPELLDNPAVRFLNLRGDQRSDVPFLKKAIRIIRYYWRLFRYATLTKTRVFHILWNNKFEHFDRTLLCLYYKAIGKQLVLTAHNVNMRKRDGTDTWLNRFSLKIQYHLVDHIFVHTERMKMEIVRDFQIAEMKVIVIPFGINNTSPNTRLSPAEAKGQLELGTTSKVILCFGQIAPYKGLEYLVRAFSDLVKKDDAYQLIIAGKPKWNESYWRKIQGLITDAGIQDRVAARIEHVPDEQTEVYFKAADVLVLPYVEIFQSGITFLAYSFGLPVLAADVGGLKESIIDGRTGYVFRPRDCADLAEKIEQYFHGEMFANLATTRRQIKDYANERYSWDKVASITTGVYSSLLR
jgi:D-inositol-3-phosphate glycosyltransferase